MKSYNLQPDCTISFSININTTPDVSLGMTQKHARYVSKSFTFSGFEDDEVYCILLKVVEMKRKSG